MTLTPNVKWAQRKDTIYITVDVPNATNVKVDLEESGVFKFSCEVGKDKYEFALNLLKEINKEESKWNNTGRNVQFVIVKKTEEEFWSNLTKEKKVRFVQCDWDKWVDEDEDKGGDEEVFDWKNQGQGMGGMGGMEGMGGMGGMGGQGMGGMDMEALQKMMSGMGGGNMGGMGGMGGMPDMDDSTQEEGDEMPNLENVD